jgi:hypothetical protein
MHCGDPECARSYQHHAADRAPTGPPRASPSLGSLAAERRKSDRNIAMITRVSLDLVVRWLAMNLRRDHSK